MMSSSATFVCNHQHCKAKVFKQVADLHQHLVSKHIMKKCSQCQNNDEYFDAFSLKKHNKKIHGKIAIQKCIYCDRFIGKKRKQRHLKFCKKAASFQMAKKWATEDFNKCSDFYIAQLAEQYGSNDNKKEQLESASVNNFRIPKRKFAIGCIPPKFRYAGLKRSSVLKFFNS